MLHILTWVPVCDSFSQDIFLSFFFQVLVVANPANTNALILKEFAPSIPEKNITCLTRLDHNRALGQISERLSVPVSDVKNVIIWGNHSSSQYPDVNHAKVQTSAGEKPVRELVKNDEYLNGEFITTVQQRGAAIIKARKLSSALSAASSACDHIRDWVLGTPEVHNNTLPIVQCRYNQR